jgi:hypothetical protein
VPVGSRAHASLSNEWGSWLGASIGMVKGCGDRMRKGMRLKPYLSQTGHGMAEFLRRRSAYPDACLLTYHLDLGNVAASGQMDRRCREGDRMGTMGRMLARAGNMCALGGCLVTIVGCSMFDTRPVAPVTPVLIESFKEVQGRWEGKVKTVQGNETGWVTVSLTDRETFATYTFAGMGIGDPFLGTGRLQLQGGRLLTEGEGRTFTFTLAEREGVRKLVVDGIGKDGKSHHAELSRAE